MNQLKNQVQLIGNLGATPELKEVSKGKYYTRVSIATNEVYVNQQNEKITNTQWHRLVLFGKQAKNLCDLASKGTRLALSGKLQHSQYTDKEGITRNSTEIHVNTFMILSREGTVESSKA